MTVMEDLGSEWGMGCHVTCVTGLRRPGTSGSSTLRPSPPLSGGLDVRWGVHFFFMGQLKDWGLRVMTRSEITAIRVEATDLVAFTLCVNLVGRPLAY